MGWQEELRRLDAELADGKITHDQHRRLRDELLASASGGAMASPRVSPLRRSETAWRSTNPGHEPRPAQAPEPPAPEPAPAEAPKRQSPAAALLDNGRPTTAPSPADHRRTESMAYPALDQPTQVLRPVPALPPLTPSRQRMPASGGPAATAPHTPSRGSGQKPTWIFISLGVLLVLALIIGGAWWLGRDGGDSGGSAAQPGTNAIPGDSAEVALEDRLPALPGTASANNSTLSIDKGVELDLYPEQAAATFREHDATKVIHRGSTEGDRSYFLLVIPTPDANSAQALADDMRGLATSSGYAQLDATQPALSTESGDRRMHMSWYASNETAVNIWVSQPREGDRRALTAELNRTIDSLGAVLPPG